MLLTAESLRSSGKFENVELKQGEVNPRQRRYWLALFSLFHWWIHLLCLYFTRNWLPSKTVSEDICHLHLINIISSIQITLTSLIDKQKLCFCRTNQAGESVGTQSEIVTATQQATVFSKGHTLSWLTNLLRSTVSSLHCSTWLSV